MAAFDRSIELDPSLRELVKIRASQINGCAYCIAMHTRDARKAGESNVSMRWWLGGRARCSRRGSAPPWS